MIKKKTDYRRDYITLTRPDNDNPTGAVFHICGRLQRVITCAHVGGFSELGHAWKIYKVLEAEEV
jgi:hypothetical protein